MNVLILSTFGNYGGAATCSRRLAQSLKKHGVDVELRVIYASDDQTCLPIYPRTKFRNFYFKFLLALERFQVLFRIKKRKHLYKYSSGRIGMDVTRADAFRNADVVHLHWVNFSFVSISGLSEMAKKKPVLWTMHDMWAFTGGCHYAMTCEGYQGSCEKCFYLNNAFNGYSSDTLNLKKDSWAGIGFKMVATSNWLADCAKSSSVFADREIEVLPTALDTSVFKVQDKQMLREKLSWGDGSLFVLFGAVDLSDERKGFEYLLEALKFVKQELSGLTLVTFGVGRVESLSGIRVVTLGGISTEREMAQVYGAADLFVLPSIQDNLPNTVMESMACGTPVVAFDCGGVSDMIDHKVNGYLARNRDAKDLAQGLSHFSDSGLRKQYAHRAALKVSEHFSEEKVVKQHTSFYRKVIADFN